MEIGPKDIEKDQCVLVRRDNREKSFVPLAGIVGAVREKLDTLQKDLLEHARAFVAANTTKVGTYDEFKKVMLDKRGFLVAQWCRDPACEAKLVELATNDPVWMVRSSATQALARYTPRVVIPVLLRILDEDHEHDPEFGDYLPDSSRRRMKTPASVQPAGALKFMDNHGSDYLTGKRNGWPSCRRMYRLPRTCQTCQTVTHLVGFLELGFVLIQGKLDAQALTFIIQHWHVTPAFAGVRWGVGKPPTPPARTKRVKARRAART